LTLASSSPNLITETMMASSLSTPTKTIATLATLPNVMALTQSASSATNPFANLNNQPTIDKTEHHLPLSLNLLGIIVGMFLAVLFLNKIFETLRKIYESIGTIAESICESNKTQQDEKGYYKRDESERVPRVFVPLVLTIHIIMRTIQAILWLRHRNKNILQAMIYTTLWHSFHPLCLQSTRSFSRGLRAYPAKMLITSQSMLNQAWYKCVTTGDHRTKLSLDILGSLKHALSGLESWIRLSPFLSKSRRPPDTLQHDPTIHQIADHAMHTANHIAQYTASFLCTIMLLIITQLATTLTLPLRAPVNHITFVLARKIVSRLAPAQETSDNTPKKDLDMDKLTQETHELHLIDPENE
jgi:hypothetical protein